MRETLLLLDVILLQSNYGERALLERDFHLDINTCHLFPFLFSWLIVHVPFVRFMRQLFYVSNEGPMPPPVLRLSDGGHIENLAILPLLKKRLKKIVVADGGHKNKDGEWGESLLKALTLAREKLHCSFIGIDGRDVIEDVKEKFVYQPQGHQPRNYRSVKIFVSSISCKQ